MEEADAKGGSGQPLQWSGSECSDSQSDRAAAKAAAPTGNGALPSAGSGGHPDECKPCTYYFSKGGCKRMEECPFCHFAHKSSNQEKRTAWKEQMRERKSRIRKVKGKGGGDALKSSGKGGLEPGSNASAPLYGFGPPGSSFPSYVNCQPRPEHAMGMTEPPPGASASAALHMKPMRPDLSIGGAAGHAPPMMPMPSGGAPPGSWAQPRERQNQPRAASPAPGLVPDLGVSSKNAAEALDLSKVGKADGGFAEQLAVLSIKGNPVSAAIGNPNLPDCPLIGISSGFQGLTGYADKDVIGTNCRFLNDGCENSSSVLMKLRHSTATGDEALVSIKNMRKDGSFFRNLVHTSGIRVGDRRYMIGIQCNDLTDAGIEISTGHADELQAILDRIFDMHVDKWAEQQLQNFCVSLPHSYCELLRMSAPEWYNNTRNAFVYQERLSTSDFPVFCKNTFLDVDSAYADKRTVNLPRSNSNPNLNTAPGGATVAAQGDSGTDGDVGTIVRSAGYLHGRRPSGSKTQEDICQYSTYDNLPPMEGPVASYASDPNLSFAAHPAGLGSESALVASSSSRSDGRYVRYMPCALLLGVGQSANWRPDMSPDLVGKCSFSISPALTPGLLLNAQTGAITGVVAQPERDRPDWIEHKVTISGPGMSVLHSNIQLKVIDFVKECNIEVLSELPGHQYLLLCKKNKLR